MIIYGAADLPPNTRPLSFSLPPFPLSLPCPTARCSVSSLSRHPPHLLFPLSLYRIDRFHNRDPLWPTLDPRQYIGRNVHTSGIHDVIASQSGLNVTMDVWERFDFVPNKGICYLAIRAKRSIVAVADVSFFTGRLYAGGRSGLWSLNRHLIALPPVNEKWRNSGGIRRALTKFWMRIFS